MNELIINYGLSKGKKILNIIIGTYLAIFCLYFSITEGVANRFEVLFFSSLIGFVLAAILILSNTLWASGTIVQIDSNTVDAKITGQNNLKIEWTNVSKINIGISYIIFFVNGGQKQQKMDLSDILYKDVKDIKSKIIEVSEYKNIPYHND